MSDPVDGKFLLIQTTDGSTWSAMDRTKMPAALDGEAAFAASGTCLITQGHNNAFLVSGGTAARVFRSNDRGKTWQVADTPMVKGTPASGIFGIAMSDSRNGIIVGGNYERPEESKNSLGFTDDGGKTWRIAVEFPFGYRSGLAYLDKYHAVVVGSSGSDVSYRYIGSWRSMDKLNYNSVQAKGRKAVWAVGPNGMISKLGSGSVKRRTSQVDSSHPVNVHDVLLSRDQVSLICAAAACDHMIDVAVVAADVPGLEYIYKVSGGRIVGDGPNVKWDLSGVRPGQYTVTAAIDDGGPWGPIGMRRTKVVTVIE